MKLAIVISLLLWLSVGSYVVHGRRYVKKNSITVLSPNNIKSKHEAYIDDYGLLNYEKVVSGCVFYPKKDSRGCRLSEVDKALDLSSYCPTIVLLDRGVCYLSFKVWNAQLAGAAAVLVADNFDEPLMDSALDEESPGSGSDFDDFINKIQIPSALITKSFAATLKKALNGNELVLLQLDFKHSSSVPQNIVEYEFWTNIIDKYGATFNEQMNFVKNFKGHAQILEKGGYTLFTPHYLSWYCPESHVQSNVCKSRCINNGRYCAPDFREGLKGKDVVYENLRQLCVHKVATDINRPWVRWDYVTDFRIRCSLEGTKYCRFCAEHVMESLDLPVDKIKECVGDPEADMENEVLNNEQQIQIGHGSRGDITIVPTLVINNLKYRGKLGRTTILKEICSKFVEGTEPRICLDGDVETSECLERNGGCWKDEKANITACKPWIQKEEKLEDSRTKLKRHNFKLKQDTLKGRVCECLVVKGVQYEGDGYTSCHVKKIAEKIFKPTHSESEMMMRPNVFFKLPKFLLSFFSYAQTYFQWLMKKKSVP